MSDDLSESAEPQNFKYGLNNQPIMSWTIIVHFYIPEEKHQKTVGVNLGRF